MYLQGVTGAGRTIALALLAALSWLMLIDSSSTAAAQRVPVALVFDRPTVKIGSTAEGAPETLFAGIVGAAVLPGGEIAVADGGNHVIRIFDGTGKHLRSFGRFGEGPGEFEGLWWVGLCPNGELLAVDPTLGRADLISSSDGKFIRSVALPPWLRGNDYLSCDRGYEITALLKQPSKLGERGKVTRFPAAVVRFVHGSPSADTLMELAGTDYYFASRVGGFSPLPLGANAHAAANGGKVYAAQNGEATVDVVDLAAGTRLSFEHGLPLSDVTADGWRNAKSDLIESVPLARTRKLLQDVLSEAPVPELHPAFLDIAADGSGRVWLRLPGFSSESVWRVMTHDGRHVASVTLPSNVKPLDIGTAHLLGVERDSLGVQTIVLYRFPSALNTR
jgi:hypothetical protein